MAIVDSSTSTTSLTDATDGSTNKDDTITGSTSSDVINAGNGNDFVFGNQGQDTLLGGNGNDSVYGGEGSDLIGTANMDVTIRNGGTGDNGGDLLYGDGYNSYTDYQNHATLATTLTEDGDTGVGNDTIFGGNGKDTIWGDNGNNDTGLGVGGNDTVFAGNGSDTVHGEGGNDVIVGENGPDVLTGGSGSDYFVYNAVSESSGSGMDTITDFHEILHTSDSAQQDKIDLRPLLGDAQYTGDDYVAANNDAHQLHWGNQTATANGVWYSHGSDGNTYVYADTNGDAVADLTIRLLGNHDLVVGDFFGVEDHAPAAVADTNGSDAVTEAGVHPGDTPFAGDPSATGNVLANDTDADLPGDTQTVTGVAAGTPGGDVSGDVGTAVTGDYGSITIAADGTWTYTLDNSDADTNALAQGATAQDVFTYTMQDSGGLTSTTTLTIDITGTNDAPIVSAALTSDADEGDTSYQVNLLSGASDVDDGETATLAVTNVTYAVDGGTASGTAPAGVSLSGSTLSVDPADLAFDHLAQGDTTTIVVSYDVTDVHGATVAQTETITITGTNDTPVITSNAGGDTASVSVAENTTAVTTVTATDVDTGTTLSYSISALVDPSNADMAKFTIDSNTGVLTFSSAPDFENPQDAGADNTYNVVVQVSDGNGGVDTQALSVTVTDVVEVVNHAPTDITLNANEPAGANNLPAAGATLGTFATTDQDVGDTFTYSLLAGTSPGFAVGSSTGILTTTSALSENSTYTLNVQTQDSDGATFSETFNIITGTNQGGGPSTGNDTLPSGSGGDPILVGDDILYGSGGNDLIFGGSGNDVIFGQGGDDILIGGGGNDTLSGANAADTFKWGSGDQGTALAPAVDTITNFSNASGGGNNDKLNLQDLLQGESHVGTSAGTLANYLHFSWDGTNTTLEVSTTGAFSSQTVTGTVGGGDQTILLQNVNLVGVNGTQDAIIHDLLSNAKLVTD